MREQSPAYEILRCSARRLLKYVLSEIARNGAGSERRPARGAARPAAVGRDAGIAGFFTAMSVLPEVPGLPTLRSTGATAHSAIGRRIAPRPDIMPAAAFTYDSLAIGAFSLGAC